MFLNINLSQPPSYKSLELLFQCRDLYIEREALWYVRYSQKETPGLFSWEFSCNQLAHRESIACNWL